MSSRRVVRAALLALIALAVAVALLQVLKVEPQSQKSESKPAVSQQLCSQNGVSMVIEFDQQAKVFCVEHQGQSGWQLLNEISAKPQGTEQYPSGFVCKLFDYPSEQDCKDTPQPSEGVWNYFFATAEQGNTWIYSVTGAGIRKPKCGDVEAWVFAEPTGYESAEPPKTQPKPLVCQ